MGLKRWERNRSTDSSLTERYPNVGLSEEQIQIPDIIIVHKWNYGVCREKAHGNQMKMSDMNSGVIRQKSPLLEKKSNKVLLLKLWLYFLASTPMIRPRTFLHIFFIKQLQFHPPVRASSERGSVHLSPAYFSGGEENFPLESKILEVAFSSFFYIPSLNPHHERKSDLPDWWRSWGREISRCGSVPLQFSLLGSSLLSSYTPSPLLCSN